MRLRFWRPLLSAVVVLFNMPREAKRTLYSLSTLYQRGIREDEYEVIVIDNGSVPPFPAAEIAGLAGRCQYVYVDPASPSPAPAVNLGLRRARGEYVGVMIDGARIASPGLLHYALRAFRAFRNPVVTALAWHLGPDIHRRAVEKHGYDQEMEDRLLEGIRWPEDGYRLFEIASFAGSSQGGWFAPKSESSSLFLRRTTFELLGGYDERFDQPGGGLVNIDTYIRACELPDSELVYLLGEGTFHQMHGGAMTGAPEEEAQRKLAAWTAQYEAIRKTPICAPKKMPHYLGQIPAAALPSILASAEAALKSGTLPTSKETALAAPPALQLLFTHDKAAEQAWVVLSTIYRGREDLRRAFPEGSKDFAQMLLSWAMTSGVTIDSDKNVLLPHKPNLELVYRLVASGKSEVGPPWQRVHPQSVPP